jgi:hypothetical protein
MVMNKTEYRDLLEKLGMTQQGAARFFGVSGRSSRRFASGDDIPPAIELLLRVMVAKKLTPEAVYKIAGLKLPETGFSDPRYDDDGKWIGIPQSKS